MTINKETFFKPVLDRNTCNHLTGEKSLILDKNTSCHITKNYLY